MCGVEAEAAAVGQVPRRRVEDGGGHVPDPTAYPTLGVSVRSVVAYEVVCRGAVTQVDVLHDPQARKGFQRAIDAGQVHRPVAAAHPLGDLLDREVAGIDERQQDRLTWSGQALSPGAQSPTHLVQ